MFYISSFSFPTRIFPKLVIKFFLPTVNISNYQNTIDSFVYKHAICVYISNFHIWTNPTRNRLLRFQCLRLVLGCSEAKNIFFAIYALMTKIRRKQRKSAGIVTRNENGKIIRIVVYRNAKEWYYNFAIKFVTFLRKNWGAYISKLHYSLQESLKAMVIQT